MPEPRVTDLPCVNVVWVDPDDPEKGMKKCGTMVPRSEHPHDPFYPILCDACLRTFPRKL